MGMDHVSIMTEAQRVRRINKKRAYKSKELPKTIQEEKTAEKSNSSIFGWFWGEEKKVDSNSKETPESKPIKNAEIPEEKGKKLDINEELESSKVAVEPKEESEGNFFMSVIGKGWLWGKEEKPKNPQKNEETKNIEKEINEKVSSNVLSNLEEEFNENKRDAEKTSEVTEGKNTSNVITENIPNEKGQEGIDKDQIEKAKNEVIQDVEKTPQPKEIEEPPEQLIINEKKIEEPKQKFPEDTTIQVGKINDSSEEKPSEEINASLAQPEQKEILDKEIKEEQIEKEKINDNKVKVETIVQEDVQEALDYFNNEEKVYQDEINDILKDAGFLVAENTNNVEKTDEIVAKESGSEKKIPQKRNSLFVQDDVEDALNYLNDENEKEIEETKTIDNSPIKIIPEDQPSTNKIPKTVEINQNDAQKDKVSRLSELKKELSQTTSVPRMIDILLEIDKLEE